MATRLARAAGATAIGITAGFAGNASSAVNRATTLGAAEQVAAQFVGGFESFSYQDPGAKESVAALTTGHLATVLSSPSQGAAGPALVAEKFTATAHVVGFQVESDRPTSVSLLARTDIKISTTTGSSSSIRLVPVSLVLLSEAWKVSAVDGLTVTSASPSSPGGTGATSDATAGSGAGSETTTASSGNASAPATTAPTAAPTTAVGDAPAAYVEWMKAAVAAECPGLPWTVLAGIAKVESNFGRSKLPGVSSGANSMGAEGPMQFEPATFATYGTVAPGGADPASPYDPIDSIYSAAHLLCADGGGNPARLYAAIFDYNHSDAYVSLVLAYANEYSQLASGASGERGLGSVIVADAETYLGTPYVWGGENPRSGFDCSGLVQWVYAEAGISLPRVAQEQYNSGPHLAPGATLYPGDLVFFGSGPSAVEHVGIYVGNGDMIDAPYTGAVVRFDRVASVSLGFVGATRPEIPDLTGGAGVPVIGNDADLGGGSGNGAGHQARAQGNTSADGVSHHGIDQSTGLSKARRHHPTTLPSTTLPGPTTLRLGRRHPTTTTVVPDPTTSTTVPGTTPPRSGRHHPPATTTTVPASTTTTETPPTTVPPTTTTTAAAGDDAGSAGTVPSAATTTTTASRPGHHHQKSG